MRLVTEDQAITLAASIAEAEHGDYTNNSVHAHILPPRYIGVGIFSIYIVCIHRHSGHWAFTNGV